MNQNIDDDVDQFDDEGALAADADDGQWVGEPDVKKRKGGASRWFIKMLRLAFLIGVLSLFGFLAFLHLLSMKGTSQEPSIFVVSRGESLRTIATDLEERGIIHSKTLFIGAAFVYGVSGKLKAGEYSIQPGASSFDILMQFTEGRILGRAVTFSEGLSNKQIKALLLNEPALVGEITSMPPEGHLLPTTISFVGGQERQRIIDKLAGLHNDLIKDIWDNRAPGLPLKSPEELVILASIVEKETGVNDERSRVAAVFVNRLKKGMRLQSDPTIIYGITGGEPLGRGIRRSELRGKTAYNTYVINGLPPTAIANPGEAALRATAHPDDTKELFFVADGSGGHVFAETLKEHQKNVKAWRAIEAKAKKEAEQLKNAEQEAVDALRD